MRVSTVMRVFNSSEYMPVYVTIRTTGCIGISDRVCPSLGITRNCRMLILEDARGINIGFIPPGHAFYEQGFKLRKGYRSYYADVSRLLPEIGVSYRSRKRVHLKDTGVVADCKLYRFEA